MYARWSEGDFRSSAELYDPLVLFVMGPGFPDAGAYLGVDRVAEYTRGFLEPWSRIAIQAEAIAEAGDTVVVSVLQRGVGKESGAPAEFRYFHVWTFRGPRVIRLESFRDRDQARMAAGLQASGGA